MIQENNIRSSDTGLNVIRDIKALSPGPYINSTKMKTAWVGRH